MLTVCAVANGKAVCEKSDEDTFSKIALELGPINAKTEFL